jgi:hypothetical protein
MPAIFELKNEWLIASYPSSLWAGALPRPGTLFISANYLCFASSPPPIKIRFLDIVHIKRFNNGGFAAQLAIQLFVRLPDSPTPKDFTFATLFQGEELYLLVVELWKATAAKVQKNASQLRREREQQRKASSAAVAAAASSATNNTKDKDVPPSPQSPASARRGSSSDLSSSSSSSSSDEGTGPASTAAAPQQQQQLLGLEETERIQQLLQAMRGTEEADSEGSDTSSGPVTASFKRDNIFLKQEHDYLCALYHIPQSQRLLTTRSHVSLSIFLRKDGKVNTKPTASNVEGYLSVFSEFLLFRSNKAAQPSTEQQQQQQQPGTSSTNPSANNSNSSNALSPSPQRSPAAPGSGGSGGGGGGGGGDGGGGIGTTPLSPTTPSGSDTTATSTTSSSSGLDVFIILPLREVQQIKKSHHQINDEYSDLGNIGVLPDTIKLYTQFNVLSMSMTNRNSLLKLLMELHQAVQGREMSVPLPVLFAGGSPSNTHPQPLIPMTFRAALRSHRVTEAMLADPREFPSTYADREREALKQFEDYMNVHGFGVAMLRGSRLRTLIRASGSSSITIGNNNTGANGTGCGIPNALRGYVWSVTSGALALRIHSATDFFESLVARALSDPSNAGNRNQIELDLHRSLPEHPYFQEGSPGLDAMRRCLLAYSMYNPTVGYCQSMNIVASLLLLFAHDAEEAFYLLTALIDLVPEYYIREMLGSIVDLRIFSGYVNKLRPRLWQHLHQQCGMDLTLVALPWFLCFFIGYLPWMVCLRVFDLFFLEGPSVLFQMGLALLTSHEEALLALKDQVAITEYLKVAVHDCDKILKLALSAEFRLESDELDQLRNFHKFQAIQEMEVNNKEADFRTLHEKSGFPKSVLEDLYANFREELYRTDALAVGFEQFVELFKKHHPPGWDLDVAFGRTSPLPSATAAADVVGDTSTTPVAAAPAVSPDGTTSKPLTPGELTALLRRLFKLFDTSGNGSLSFLEYVFGLDVLYNGPQLKRQQRSPLCYSTLLKCYSATRWLIFTLLAIHACCAVVFQLYDGNDDGLIDVDGFAAAARTLYLLSLQFSEKQRRQVHKSNLAILLERYHAKQSGSTAVEEEPSPRPSTHSSLDDLNSDWTYLSLDEQFGKTFPYGKLRQLFEQHRHDLQGMTFEEFQRAFDVTPLLDATISDKSVISD